MTGASTLVELLIARASPGGAAGAGYRFEREDGSEDILDLAALETRARALASHLLAHGRRGDRVLLYYPPGLDFIIGFFATGFAGMTAVPVPCPRGGTIGALAYAATAAVIADCTPRMALTTSDRVAALPAAASREGVTWIASDALPPVSAGPGPPFPAPGQRDLPSPDDIAYLQYTSGSTGMPKGVMITHAQALANLAAIGAAMDLPAGAPGVTWLPHFHDMGLAGGILFALYGGHPLVLMAPQTFLNRPVRWLRALTRHRGVWSGAPNFAYELCHRHIAAGERDGLDLRHWRVAVSGAEPVRRATVDRFAAAFAPVGFDAAALRPFYGLAESVVFVSGTRAGRGPRMVGAPAADGEASPTLAYAACGTAAAGHHIALVNPETRERQSFGSTGEIWVRGPSVAGGYWGRAAESEAVFGAQIAGEPGTRWLRTGDTGFLDQGELVVTGRLKDLIIIAGTNHVPHDIEATVEAAHAAVRPGNVVAFAVEGDTDALVVAAERPLHQLGLGSLELADLRAAIEQEMTIDLPLERLLRGWSIAEIAAERAAPPGTTAGRHPWETLVNPEIGALLRRFRLDRPFTSGAGAWLTWDDGTRILDAIAGFGALPFGHNPPEIWQALDAARTAAAPSLVQPSMNDAAGALADALLAIAPPGLRHVCFANSGAEATEIGLKIARAATGRPGFLSTTNGFHGKTLGALSVTGRDTFQAPFGAPVLDVDYVPFGDIAALERVLVETGTRYAGFIVEPIQGEAGIVEPPRGYLAAAASLCRAHGVLLIVDEIQTGLGRTGAMFACDVERVAPDILLIAKALGGGVLPIGAVLYASGCHSAAFAGKHSSTFAGNGLACRVGLAALARLTADGGRLVDMVAERGARLEAGLRGVADRYPAARLGVRGRGYLLGLQLPAGRAAPAAHGLLDILAEQAMLAPLVASYLLNVCHVRVAPTLLGSEVVRIEPPLTLTEAEAELIVAAVGQVARLLAAGDGGALVNHLLDAPLSASAIGQTRTPPRPSAPSIVVAKHDARPWAFLAHPLDAAGFAAIDDTLARFSVPQLTELTDRLGGVIAPFVANTLSVEGRDRTACGTIILVPWTAQALACDRAGGLAAIRAAAELARTAGAGVVGLGGYCSIACGGGSDLAGSGVPVTTGNSYTAIAAVDAMAAACDRLDRPLDKAVVGIVGGGGSVGLGLAYLMAERVSRIVLVGNPGHRRASLARLRSAAAAIAAALIAGRDGVSGDLARRALAYHDRTGADAAAVANWLILAGDVELAADHAALAACDVVFTATSSPDLILAPELFRPNAILCDVSQPRNIGRATATARHDLLVLDGGLVAVPGAPDLGVRFGLAPGVAFACMCEPMILALEGRFDAAPIGLGVPLDYLRALRGWGARHGFRIAAPTSFGRPLEPADWRARRAHHLHDQGEKYAQRPQS
ncbi:aminotransferase class III-fold pyridoxal phosphate-dependent enzyme [Sphingomonas sp. BK481]|uniref:aminotransferase class III-fold pyridoxal phosphate-dependent enzyme n=1 Tax=Sphingomonas sp. BK481 TaxID=2586981 RepID=UPI001610AD8B|nr:aminotransferase class III-fold pyridoxal phosphate-dependent enzyme [Sphingomonas sp. BK481]MBB3587509.1 acetylornithine/succinyldiaminopimelate/putrescine aminotransferase/acyl-CoA synthetase (AMP-forming)/AMP-acid ligase II/predicted amino acid dehydrogenase [Sphingomonas sp. BK481]